MPSYDYECLKCGKEIEVTQRITEDAFDEIIHQNPEGKSCNGKVKRLISKSTAFKWKGSPPTPKFYS